MQITIYIVVTPAPNQSNEPAIPLNEVPKVIALHLQDLHINGWAIKEVR